MLFGKNNGNNSTSIISGGVKMEGKIYFPGSARVDGIVVGDIISENTLTIGKEGEVESNIKTKNAVVSDGNRRPEKAVHAQEESRQQARKINKSRRESDTHDPAAA